MTYAYAKKRQGALQALVFHSNALLKLETNVACLT